MVSRRIYDDLQRKFRFYDDANAGLDKKAQSLMIGTALLTALFTTMVASSTGGVWNQEVLWNLSALVFMLGMLTTFWLCIWVNHARPKPTPSVGEELLRHDKLDTKAYAKLVAGGEEEYYKLCIKEAGLALTEVKCVNKTKTRLLDGAYIVFAIFVAALIPGLVFGFF